MKIGVDYQSAQGKRTGIGVFAATLVEAIRREDPDMKLELYAPAKGSDLHTPGRIAWESISLPLRAARKRPDLLYSPGFGAAMWSPVPQVVTVHDIIGMRFPDNQKRVSGFYWSKWLPVSLKRARCLVASSESTRRDLEELLGIPHERVRVVPLAVDGRYKKTERGLESFAAKHGITGPYFICVSTLEPRKNHKNLIEAMKILKDRGRGSFSLVVIGKDAGTGAALKCQVEESGLAERVHFPGYIPDRDLIGLYNEALGYAAVSFYEGFGLPVLEAMSCGLTGVVSERSSLPEVAGDTGILVNPDDPGQIADALHSLYEDAPLRERLSTMAYGRAQTFSIKRVASEMIEVFKNAV